MKYAVVDTNVLVVADGRSPQADEACLLDAERSLQRIQDRRSLVLDDGWRILGEYLRNVDRAKQPGVGSRFFMWAARSSDIRRVTITYHPDREFVEFPDTVELATFHRDDRKFVAATIVSGTDRTELVNAVDNDYREHDQALRDVKVVVTEVCRHLLG